jgi:hypothetical protein
MMLPTPRRLLLLVVAAAVLVIGAVLPAQASFLASKAVSTTIATTTVVAPGNVDTSGSWCTHGVLSASASWTASTSARVTGYTITAYYQSGNTRVIASTGPDTTSVGGVVVPNQGSSPAASLTVTTTTDYGWTAQSPRVAVPPC